MPFGISTHIVLPQRLTPALLDQLSAPGIRQIEIFASRHHIDYTDRAAVRELANWFRSHEVAASMHMPLFSPDDERNWSRHTAPTLNLISAHKPDRILAMDETKRALELAEQVPVGAMVVHLGRADDEWSTRTLDDSLTAIEHLKAFAGPLGVQLLLENLNNAVATPEHLLEIVRVGHFSTVRFCLDLGHAHLEPGTPETSHAPAQTAIAAAFAAFGDRLAELHVHDNNGTRDTHNWPGDGTIDFAEVRTLLAGKTSQPAAILEIAHELEFTADDAAARIRKASADLGLATAS